jgi:tRNA nucleotidyltransferase/poly(A) polymerase
MDHIDIDLVIRNVPLEPLIEWLHKQGKVDVVGKSFGVIKFRPQTNLSTCIDISLPRTEQSLPQSQGGYRDTSVQSDENLSMEDDLSRRDFTVNAMAFNFHTHELIDPFGGKQDLENHLLRAVGDPAKRFKEDLTRILRGLRFACSLQFEIEPDTFTSMKALIPELNHLRSVDGLKGYVVSRETIGDELSKAFFANPSQTVHLLQELGALEELFPSVWRHTQIDAHYLEPLYRAKPHHLEHTIVLLLRNLTTEEVRTTLSFTGLESISKQSSRRLDVDHILWMIQKLSQRLTPQNITVMRASHFEKQFLGTRGTQHMDLLEHLGHQTVVEAAKKRRAEICTNWNCDDDEPIPPLVSGDDVLRQGIPAGMRVREILEMIRDEQLDGKILTREAAIRFIKQQME